MPEEADIGEIKEGLERLEHGHHEGGGVSFSKYLALTTALIAVIAALATLRSGNLVNQALLAKNDAVLLQAKASDQYSYYQAKGIKKNLAEFAQAMGKPKAEVKKAGAAEVSKTSDEGTAKPAEKSLATAKPASEHPTNPVEGGKDASTLAGGEVERYGREQEEIKKTADELTAQAEESNVKSTEFLENHHQAALSVTFFQISIALAAMSALLKRKSFWFFSVLGGALGVIFFTLSFL